MAKSRSASDDFEFEASPAQTRRLIVVCLGAVFALSLGLGTLVYMTLTPVGRSSSESASSRMPSLLGLLAAYGSGGKTSAREFDGMMSESCAQMAGVMGALGGAEDDSRKLVAMRRAQARCRGN